MITITFGAVDRVPDTSRLGQAEAVDKSRAIAGGGEAK